MNEFHGEKLCVHSVNEFHGEKLCHVHGVNSLCFFSIVLAHNRLGAPVGGFLLGSPTRAASGDDDGDEAASEMQRLKIIEVCWESLLAWVYSVACIASCFLFAQTDGYCHR